MKRPMVVFLSAPKCGSSPSRSIQNTTIHLICSRTPSNKGLNETVGSYLTGPATEVDRLMAEFKLRRQREPDGSVDHVLEFFLVGSDGHLLQYVAFDVNPLKIAGDVEQAADGKRLVESAQEDTGGDP